MNRAVIANESRRTEIEFGYDDDSSVNFNHGKVKGERGENIYDKDEVMRIFLYDKI